LAGRFHRRLTRGFWSYAVGGAVILLVAFLTGSVEAGEIAAIVLCIGVPVALLLLVGLGEWKAGRRFRAPRGRVVSSHQVMEHGWPILCVRHAADDPSVWQFINGDGDTDDESDRVTVHIQQLIGLDPSICTAVDVPPGWRASRPSEDAPWSFAPDGQQTLLG
jgi:hypothetical protein